MSKCKYCKRPVDSKGFTYHLGNCTGLKKVEINRLQYDALQAEIARLREVNEKYTFPPKHRVTVAEAEVVRLRKALQTIVNADRSYPDKRIADDMQYCARAALNSSPGQT